MNYTWHKDFYEPGEDKLGFKKAFMWNLDVFNFRFKHRLSLRARGLKWSISNIACACLRFKLVQDLFRLRFKIYVMAFIFRMYFSKKYKLFAVSQSPFSESIYIEVLKYKSRHSFQIRIARHGNSNSNADLHIVLK